MDKPFELSEKDLMKIRKFCKSKEFDKVIEKFNKGCEERKILNEDRRIRDAEWWAKNKDIPFTI